MGPALARRRRLRRQRQATPKRTRSVRGAFRYRDYVIRAFNDDKPFDRFLAEQLAGDELLTPPYQEPAPDQADLLAATGFLRMAPDGTAARRDDQNIANNDVVADTIKIVSSSVLGMTVGCAQCHNHRYDAISQVDYYRFRAIFEPAPRLEEVARPERTLVSLWQPARGPSRRPRSIRRSSELNARRAAALDEIVQDIFRTRAGQARRRASRGSGRTPAAFLKSDRTAAARPDPQGLSGR